MSATSGYDDFIARQGKQLRRALVATYGVDIGVEACEDALAHAWERWAVVELMDNRLGYLYRVGQSASRRYRRWLRQPNFPPEPKSEIPTPEPALHLALARMAPRRRVTVVLVHGYRWSYVEVANMLGVPESTVRNDVYRGIAELRRTLGVTS